MMVMMTMIQNSSVVSQLDFFQLFKTTKTSEDNIVEIGLLSSLYTHRLALAQILLLH